MYIDTHTHLNFKVFDQDVEKIVSQAIQSGVSKMIVVGTDIDSSKSAISLAKSNPALYASVGIHPHHAKKYLPLSPSHKKHQLQNDIEEINILSQKSKVVAIGEVGLDYYKYKSSKYQLDYSQDEWQHILQIQQEILSSQVELSISHNLPLIIHSRQLKDQVLDQILRVANNRPIRGVFHCFEGSKKYARKIIEAGFYISFTGNITYLPQRQAVADTVPLDKLLLETDSPYMTPIPKRKQRNQPSNVKIIASHHSKSRNVDISIIKKVTSKNANDLFNLTTVV